MSVPVNNVAQPAQVNNTAQPASINAAKTALLASQTVYSISQLLDYIVANPTGFFTIVEKAPPKAGKTAAPRTGAGASVTYFKQQWDFGNGTKFTGNLRFNLVGNAPDPDSIPESVYPEAREDILAGNVRMYRGIANPDDQNDHRNHFESGDGKGSGGMFKVSVSSTEAGKLGQFMILLDELWKAECERIKKLKVTMQQKGINTLTSAFISQGEKAGTMKDAPTFMIKIPINETYPASFRSRAGQPKAIILDASTAYTTPTSANRRFLKAAVDTADGPVIVDGTNAWQFVEGGSKFVTESEFEFGDPNFSGYGFSMPLVASIAVIERRSGGGLAPTSSLVGNEDEYLASINRSEYSAPAVTTSMTTPAPAAALSPADDKAMLELLNQFQ